MQNTYDFIANIDVSMANAIRKTIISRVPSIVIDTITVIENDSSMSDEMIALRLGLIPLKVDKNLFKDSLMIKLYENGPKKIYSKDIIFPEGIEPISPDFLILNLSNGQKIDLIGTLEEGNAHDQNHAKYSISCGTTYKKISDNKVQFHIETTGTIDAKSALKKAINILKEDFIYYRKIFN